VKQVEGRKERDTHSQDNLYGCMRAISTKRVIISEHDMHPSSGIIFVPVCQLFISLKERTHFITRTIYEIRCVTGEGEAMQCMYAK
jgi:hypothetical protein